MGRWTLISTALAFLVASALAYTFEWRHAPALAVLAGGAAIWIAVRASSRGWASPASVYLMVYFAFHFGLLVSDLMGWEASLEVSGFQIDLSSPEIVAASALASIGASAVALAVASMAGSEPGPSTTVSCHHGLAVAGGALLYSGITGWILLLYGSGGLPLVNQGYIAWLEATAGRWPSSALIYLCIGLGLPLMIAGSRMRARRIALAAYSLWAIPALAIGLRGEVLLPALAGLVVEARRRRLLWRWSYALGAVVALALGALIRVGRQGGGWSAAAMSPVDGLAEMGYSIRPVVLSWTWHGPGAEPFVGWGTYWAWLDRLLDRLTGLGHVTADSDPRVFNSVMLERVGPIGGSPVAEAFRSQGVLAVAVVMLAVGLMLAMLDRLPTLPMANALVGGSSFILLLWVRNSFTPVLAQFLLLSGALLGAYALDALLSALRPRVGATSP